MHSLANYDLFLSYEQVYVHRQSTDPIRRHRVQSHQGCQLYAQMQIGTYRSVTLPPPRTVNFNAILLES